MSSHSVEKKSDPKELEKVISPILVVNQSKLKPFIELFENYPENIMLQGLGAMFGFFKINDKSEDSAYIVNFLSSVIKKEYFINHKRPVSESLDSALHKVNLALSEVAKNGNIRWIGQLDAAICILEKNVLHFTVCGAAKILLLRNQLLSDISVDLNPEELEPNPMKTFSNVSSGYLEKDDKIIITSSELFNIFSLNELKKGALRFDQDKFVQFLKTAMVNELDAAATIVIDLNERVIPKEARKTKTKNADRPVNPFDSKTFEKPILSPQDTTLPEEKNDLEYTDEKTGHIYVQGHPQKSPAGGFWNRLGISLEEIFNDFSFWLKIRLKKTRLSWGRLGAWLKEKMVLLKIKLNRSVKERRRQEEKEPPPESAEIAPLEMENLENETLKHETEEAETTQDFPLEIATASETAPETGQFWTALGHIIQKAKRWKFPRLPWRRLLFLLPAFSRIKFSYLKLNYHQRLYALLSLIVIVVTPLLFLKFRTPQEVPIQREPEPQISQRDIILGDKNIREVAINPSTIVSSGLQKVIFLNDQIFTLGSSEISLLGPDGSIENFAFPPEFQSLYLAAPMEDLNLIFLLSQSGQLFSWSPLSKKFQENTLVLPEKTNLKAAGTYLTYLYLVDNNTNQIFRYPRATGGFGDKTEWLKDPADLSGAVSIAIEENIYLATPSEISKFFQGKKQPFNLEPAVVPLAIHRIFTNGEISYLYVLDSQNGRVVRFSKDGQLLNQYYNEKLKGAVDFAVSEKNNQVFFVSSEGLSTFSM